MWHTCQESSILPSEEIGLLNLNQTSAPSSPVINALHHGKLLTQRPAAFFLYCVCLASVPWWEQNVLSGGSHVSCLIRAERKKGKKRTSSILWDWHRHTLYCGSPATHMPNQHSRGNRLSASSGSLVGHRAAAPTWKQLILVLLACKACRKHDALLCGSPQGCLGVIQTRRKWCMCMCAATDHRANISRHSSKIIQLITQRSLTAVMVHREDSNAASDDPP